MKRVKVKIMRLPHGADLPLPAYQSADAAGLDLMAAVPAGRAGRLAPGARAHIPTGIAIALPPGTEGQVRPRSGLAARHGISVLNTPGTIDSDYRGEIQVILVNLGGESFLVERGHAHCPNGHRACFPRTACRKKKAGQNGAGAGVSAPPAKDN